ncbi:Ankyrin repeat [Oxalobacteraceae bacterium]
MSLPTLTPVTTVHQPHNLTTTTTVNPTSSNQTPSPALRTRPAGWHAKSFGFDWNLRADQHKYLVKSGLPEVHAAIMNDDWDLALELICPEDLGLHWLPPASQRPSKSNNASLDTPNWALELESQDKAIRNNAILNMAIYANTITSTGDNCLYGANLLTLCLLKPARPDVMQHVISLAKTQAPHYLNLPDAIGRTPLWVAIENQDQASVQLLLKAGANPLQDCEFSAEGEPKSPLSFAAKYANKEFFRDLVRAMIDHVKDFTPYDFNKDPLFIRRWAAGHSSKDVMWLADQLEVIRGPLLCCKDLSGTSYFYRSVIDGSLDKKITIDNEDLIEWLKTLDISSGSYYELESSPLYAAASVTSIPTYLKLADFLLEKLNENPEENNSEEFTREIYENFLLSRTAEEIDLFLDKYSKDSPEMDEDDKLEQKNELMQSQYNLLLRNQHTLDFDNYARLVKSVWPFISDKQKNTLFLDAATRADDRMDLVFGMLDCALNIKTVESILQRAASIGNARAFEFAADRSFKMGEVLESLKAGNDVGHGMLYWALTAGSLKWVNKLINAGFDLQAAIYRHPALIIALADLDPQGLAKKLKGLDYKIIPRMIEQAMTEEGKQALKALMKDATNHI